MDLSISYLCRWYFDTHEYYDLFGGVGDRTTCLRIVIHNQNDEKYVVCADDNRNITYRGTFPGYQKFFEKNNIKTIDDMAFYLNDNRIPYEYKLDKA